MPAFRTENCLFLYFHIPKAGGTSIEEWLSGHAQRSLYQKHRPDAFPCVPQHFDGELINKLFAPGFFDYSFCVTRNPYARALSEYNYRITRPRLKNRILPKPSFKRWLRGTLSKYPGNRYIFSNHIRPQHEFMIDGTEFFRLEDGLGALRRRLADLTGIALGAELPRKNVSVKTSTTMPKDCAAMIRDFYAGDFERFGYDPDRWDDLNAASAVSSAAPSSDSAR